MEFGGEFMVKIPYDQHVSGRITEQSKELMKTYDFSVRDAVEFYILNMKKPTGKLSIRRKDLIQKINSLKIDLIAAEMELESIENLLDSKGDG